jgi:hypothetical protein
MRTGKLRKLKMEARTGIQNGRLNAGNCFNPSILSTLSILSIPKKLNKEKRR